MVRNVVCAVALAAALLGFSGPAAAQAGPGVRAGVSVDPDQFYFGGHFETDPLLEHLYFRPNVEVGVGSDVTTVAFNIEAIYKFPLKRRGTSFYAGGGPAVIIYDRDNGSDTEGGLNLLGGLEFGKFFFEVKGGVFDSPNLKVGIGYTFR
jgi:hypothetical protein